MKELAVIILAAGKSSRMRGRDKLTERINGIPQIRRIAITASEAFQRVFITLPYATHPRASFLKGLEVEIIPVLDSNFGMGRSIATAIKTIQRGSFQGAMIIPADMPELTKMDLVMVANAFKKEPKAIIQATTEKGKKGHPVIFPRMTFKTLMTLRGDAGARSIIISNQNLIQHVKLPLSHAETDLDTPEQWQEWLSNSDGS